jgi:hypothetical protein
MAMNQRGRRGPHFEAILREHASLMIKRPPRCRLHTSGSLRGPPYCGIIGEFLSAWGARLTWNAQRKHATQILRVVETHKATTTFISSVSTAVYGDVGMGLGDKHAGVGAGNRGFCMAGEWIGRGLEGTIVHGHAGLGVRYAGMGLGASLAGVGACNRGFDTVGGEIGRGLAV